jgi:hypothetical protein
MWIVFHIFVEPIRKKDQNPTFEKPKPIQSLEIPTGVRPERKHLFFTPEPIIPLLLQGNFLN